MHNVLVSLRFFLSAYRIAVSAAAKDGRQRVTGEVRRRQQHFKSLDTKLLEH